MNYEKIGKRIELLIFEKGFSTIRSFAKYLAEEYPTYRVSEDTLYNIVKGEKMRNETLECIAKGLGLPQECLMVNDIKFVDDYLFDEVLPVKEKMQPKGNGINDRAINNLLTVKWLMDLSNCFYPARVCSFSEKYEYHITTLAELSMYFPLCRMEYLMDVISRIRGQVENYESYILDKYEWLYTTIPEIPAKAYVDCTVLELRFHNNLALTEEEKRLLDKIQQIKQTEEYWSGYKQYTEIIDKTYDLYRNDVMQSIVSSRLPEVYSDWKYVEM